MNDISLDIARRKLERKAFNQLLDAAMNIIDGSVSELALTHSGDRHTVDCCCCECEPMQDIKELEKAVKKVRDLK